ncbi:MAG: hypothetical protein Ct9H300mP25_08360 [Acidobacteriota bacterium]|nr:MAG: hypothetical protein Ct9H300mP25_08360 [Acidobacteriota bacterium]
MATRALYLAACTLCGLGTMIVAFSPRTLGDSRRQLRWVVSGAVLGGVPFAGLLRYSVFTRFFSQLLVWSFSAIALGLIPLAFCFCHCFATGCVMLK